MNPQQPFELMILRHQALLAEHQGCPLPAPRRPGSWLAHIQRWLSANKALYRATAPHAYEEPMNLLNPILADIFVAELRQQIQDSGPQPRFKVDELALWHADQKASSNPARPPRILKIGPFTYGWHRPQEQTKPC